MAQINPSNVATQINRYDEYGVPQSGFAGRFGYAGAMYLNRGMAAPWNMRNRQYNPTLGRFMQTDPIGVAGGVNLYGYVGGDPANAVDPFGLQEDDVTPVTIWGCGRTCQRRLDRAHAVLEEFLRSLGNFRADIGGLRDAEICDFIDSRQGEQLRELARAAARALVEIQSGSPADFRDGYLLRQFNVGGAYVIGHSGNAGIGVEIRDGLPGRTYFYLGNSWDYGFNADLTVGTYFVTSSNIGRSVNFSGSLFLTLGVFGSWDSNSVGGMMGIESGAGYALQFSNTKSLHVHRDWQCYI